MDPRRTPRGTSVYLLFFLILIDHESHWMHQVAPRTLKAPKIDQQVTPGIHIARIRDIFWRSFWNNFGSIQPKHEEVQRTLHPTRASKTSEDVEVLRCRASVLNNMYLELSAAPAACPTRS